MNRKGVMQGAAEVAMALIILVIGVIIMNQLAANNAREQEEESKTALAHAHLNNVVGTYLKHSVTVQGESYTMAELIVISKANEGDYLDTLKRETDAFFSGAGVNLFQMTVDNKDLMKKYYVAENPKLGGIFEFNFGHMNRVREFRSVIEFTLVGPTKVTIRTSVIL